VAVQLSDVASESRNKGAGGSLGQHVKHDTLEEELAADMLGAVLANRKAQLENVSQPLLLDPESFRQLALNQVLSQRLPYLERLKLKSKSFRPRNLIDRDPSYQAELPFEDDLRW